MKALGFLFVAALSVAGAAKFPTDDVDLQVAQDPREWKDDEFVPFNGDRFDGFDWELFKMMQRSDRGNLVVSPIGIKILLVMLYEGTAGNSAKELESVLQLPQARQQTRLKYSAVLESLEVTSPDYAFDLGTKMYVDSTVFPRTKFLKILKYFYNTDMERIDFLQPQTAAKKINTWVEGATNGRITDIISNPEEDLELVKLMLVNAIYFKGTWLSPFSEEETVTLPFNTSPGRAINVDYMGQTNNYYHYNSTELDAQILRLPYKGKKFSMFVVLPNSPTGITRLLEMVNPTLVRKIMANMTQVEIDVLIPKFKFDYTAQLVEILQKLGLNEIFSESADLQGVLSRRQVNNLYVSNIVQKATIEVNEQGTTAAAATQISTGNRFGQNLIFHARHPFLFFIEDETTGTVLFVGKVTDPTSTANVFRQPSGPVKTPARKPTRIPVTDGIGTRMGNLPEVNPHNFNWAWQYPIAPNSPYPTNNNHINPNSGGNTFIPRKQNPHVYQQQPTYPQTSEYPQQAVNPQTALFPQTSLYPAGTSPLLYNTQSYPPIILYPIYIQGRRR